MKLPHITQKVDHFCVEGWNARAEWTGVRMSDLARLAGLTADAGYVDFQSFDDDYHESWDMASAMHPQTLIAYGMDGRLLGPQHGAPARLHSPVKLGYKNTKYLTKVVFMPARNGGYWSDQGYEWYGGT
jgi:DMSO/TMAO reductase YedYZ molybdopterin-dependent catalytic subunit